MAKGLTLTRKPGECVILIADDGTKIAVTVNEIRRNQVRIDFDAPDDVEIWREELLEEMERERHEQLERLKHTGWELAEEYRDEVDSEWERRAAETVLSEAYDREIRLEKFAGGLIVYVDDEENRQFYREESSTYLGANVEGWERDTQEDLF